MIVYHGSYAEISHPDILHSRNNVDFGNDDSEYDVVMGGVANDKVFNTVELYFDGLIDKAEAIKRLKYEKPNFQIAFRTQEAIEQYLHFEGVKSFECEPNFITDEICQSD